MDESFLQGSNIFINILRANIYVVLYAVCSSTYFVFV